MNIYIDESGSINRNLSKNNDFVVAMICPKDKKRLERAYKRFVSSNINRLQELDRDKIDSVTGCIKREGGKMFLDGRFRELKGNQFDSEMKIRFVDFFTRGGYFDLFYIRLHNHKLNGGFCANTARGFNYCLKNSLAYYIKKGMLPSEDILLQLDERNERTETRFFLEEYLNTELVIPNDFPFHFRVKYFDSSDNRFIQIADVFANIYYSHLMTGAYKNEFVKLKQNGVLKHIYEFPLS